MLKNILSLKGVQKLDQEEKKTIKAGSNRGVCYDTCPGGLCLFGECYYYVK